MKAYGEEDIGRAAHAGRVQRVCRLQRNWAPRNTSNRHDTPLCPPRRLLLLAACGTDSAGSSRGGRAPTEGPAAGDYVADGLPAPFEAGDTLRVTLGDGEISFQATCNTTSGLIDWDDGVLRASSLGSTEMGCPGPGSEQDEWLVDFFTASPAFQVDGMDVRLATDADEIWLVPADEVDPGLNPDTALQGTYWRLTGIEQTDGDSIGMMVVPRRLNQHGHPRT